MKTISSSASSRNKFSRTPKQIRLLSQKGRNPADQQLGGVRHDVNWSRIQTTFQRSNLDLLNAVIFQHTRRGARMTDADRQTLAELDLRSWGYRECESMRIEALPSWIADQLPLRRSAGYHAFLGIVLSAYRAGAIGVWMSYAECMAICRVGSESTWRRWTEEMENLGLVRMVQTWVPDDSDSGRPRVFGSMLYRIGPTLEAWGGAAIIERAVAPRSAKGKASRLAGIQARKKQRERCRERLRALYERRAKCSHEKYKRRRKAPFLCPENTDTSDAVVNVTYDATSTYMAPHGGQNSTTTPLRDFDDRNALPPSEPGGEYPPHPGGGVFDKAQPTPQAAPVAIGHGESALRADSRPTPQIFAEFLAKIGCRPKDIARMAGVSCDPAHTSSTSPVVVPKTGQAPPVGRTAGSADAKIQAADPATKPDPAKNEPQTPGAGHSVSEKARELGLSGPMASELADFFCFFADPNARSRF